jgi:hypothetical protein
MSKKTSLMWSNDWVVAHLCQKSKGSLRDGSLSPGVFGGSLSSRSSLSASLKVEEGGAGRRTAAAAASEAAPQPPASLGAEGLGTQRGGGGGMRDSVEWDAVRNHSETEAPFDMEVTLSDAYLSKRFVPVSFLYLSFCFVI